MNYVESNNDDKKLTGFALVVLLHVVLGYALVNGLARRISEVVRPPLKVRIIEDIKPPPDAPPPDQRPLARPSRRAAPPPDYVTPAEVQVPDAPAAITAITSTIPGGPIAGSGQGGTAQAGSGAQARPVRRPPLVDANACACPCPPEAGDCQKLVSIRPARRYSTSAA